MQHSNVLLYPHRVAPVSAAGFGDALYGLVNRAAALVLLVLFAPLLLFIAWRIAREDGSPMLFGHYRVGRNGELFRCLKFRTMAVDAENILRRLLEDDARLRAPSGSATTSCRTIRASRASAASCVAAASTSCRS